MTLKSTELQKIQIEKTELGLNAWMERSELVWRGLLPGVRKGVGSYLVQRPSKDLCAVMPAREVTAGLVWTSCCLVLGHLTHILIDKLQNKNISPGLLVPDTLKPRFALT